MANSAPTERVIGGSPLAGGVREGESGTERERGVGGRGGGGNRETFKTMIYYHLRTFLRYFLSSSLKSFFESNIPNIILVVYHYD